MAGLGGIIGGGIGQNAGGNGVGGGDPQKDELKSLSDFMGGQGNISAEGILDLMHTSLDSAIDFLEGVKRKANSGQAGRDGEHLNLVAQQWIDKLENKQKEDRSKVNTIG